VVFSYMDRQLKYYIVCAVVMLNILWHTSQKWGESLSGTTVLDDSILKS